MKKKDKTTDKKALGSKNNGVINYPVGDFLIRIKNASIAGKKTVVAKKTNLIVDVAKTLKKLGFLENVDTDKENITVKLQYQNKQPLLTDIKLVSTPGLRIYMSADELEKIKKPTFLIITTSKGVFSKDEALKKRVGGEVIAEIL
jgi:small subunit ribosomal protein S8